MSRLRNLESVPGGDICRAARALTDDGRTVFVKRLADAPAGFFAAEAEGLAFLRVDGGPPLPEVLAVRDDELVLEWIDPAPPGVAAAEDFGRALAAMHAHGPAAYGRETDGYIATLRLDNEAAATWSQFYVERRIQPFLGALDASQRAVIDELCAQIASIAGPDPSPARIHGDLWSGNLLWAAERCWLVDASSAHAGHPETDLAMLALFGAPYLDRILDAYAEVADLAPGWRERTPLHHVHPLLVHSMLFGGGYPARAAAAAEAALRLR